MRSDSPVSETALLAAAARAAHLIVDGPPPIFVDPLAAALLGDRADELLAYHRLHGDHPILACARTQVVVRARCTEDLLARRVRDGLTQYVILGAGLDSYAYRTPLGGLRVFEVDRPATQAFKRSAVAAAGIGEPAELTFVPVEFGVDPLADRLVAAGYDPAEPALVSWLGVTMYLSAAAVAATLAVLAGFAPGTEVVADYMLPANLRDAAGQQYAEQVAAASADRGEPWDSCFAPDEMGALLARHGFAGIGRYSQRDAVDPTLWDRTDALRPTSLQHLVHATVWAGYP